MMKKVIRTSGRRIRKTDENLIFHTILSLCLGIFIVVLICFYGKRLSQINWSEVNLKKIGSMRPTPYFFYRNFHNSYFVHSGNMLVLQL